MNQEFRHRWDAISEPGWELNELVFANHVSNSRVLNCAVPVARARALTDFALPTGWSREKCLIASGQGIFPDGLSDWKYTPHTRPEAQLPQMKKLPGGMASLQQSPFFETASQTSGMCLNARHLRYHHQLWHGIKPQTLRGLHTTLVFVTPQLGYSLTPHIQLQRAFRYFTALSRAAGPAQLFPAKYLYPDANLAGFEDAPAPIFSDILPHTGGVNFPVMECTPDPWGVLSQFDVSDENYGYPFSKAINPLDDVTLTNVEPGVMILPDGRRVMARSSESYVYATGDEKLREELKRNREGFAAIRCLDRGTITHDGLPYQLPVEMQSMVYAIILTHWELTMDTPGDLTSYTLKMQHAAIRGFNFFQHVEPYYSNFMRLINELAKDPDFRTYPLSTHLTHNWLGGNLCISNQASRSEKEIGGDLMRHYYLQQLDWMSGVTNLWNHISFRKGTDLENTLGQAGLAFHQMRRMLKFDSHYFQRPLKRVSAWPNLHPGWLELDSTGKIRSLPRI